MKISSISRRQFIRQMTLGCSAALMSGDSLLLASRSPVQIAEIEVFPVNYPMKGRFKFFEGPGGHMKGRAAAIIKITASDGTVGWGESVPIPKWSYETLETVTTTVRNYLRPVLIGHNVFDLKGVHKIMNQNIAASISTGQPMAKAGIDIALHDLIGKLKHQSIPYMWRKQSSDKIELSWTLNPKNLNDVDRLIDEGLKRGYRHFNVKVAPDVQVDLELCRIVKERLPDTFLWADANGGYDLESALEIAPRLADIGVDILEQPIAVSHLSGYRQLRKQGALPIIMDEGIVSPRILIEFIRLDLLDGVAMKPARCGGLISAKHQIEILIDSDLLFLGSGLTDPDISLAATLALYGAFEYKLPAALNGPQFIATSVLKHPLIPENGFLAVPVGEGLGIEVDESKIEQILVKI